MIVFSKIRSATLALFCGAGAATTLFAGESAPDDAFVPVGGVISRSDSSPEKFFTPARATVRIRRNLITPFYASYAQSLPASISTGGKLAASVYGTGASWRYVAPDKTRVALTSVDYRRTDFRFSGGNGYAPFAHMDSIRATTYQEFINPENGRALVGFLSGSAAADDRADLADGAGCFVGLAGKQYFSEETSVMLGVSASYNCARERWYFYPIFSIDWSIAKNLNLRTLNGLTLTWDVGGENVWLVDFSVGYETQAFAVATGTDDGASGAFYRKRVPVGVAATWNISENFFVGAGITLDAWSEFRRYRSGHKTSEKFSTDPTLEFSLQAGIRF